jgi:hypothetical protein
LVITLIANHSVHPRTICPRKKAVKIKVKIKQPKRQSVCRFANKTVNITSGALYRMTAGVSDRAVAAAHC